MPDVSPIKTKHGVPAQLGSCHTSLVGGYVIEGHVPAQDIRACCASGRRWSASPRPACPRARPAWTSPARRPIRSSHSTSRAARPSSRRTRRARPQACGMIIRRFASSQQLITQPAHAALAERIMRNWQLDGFPESPRRASILRAIEQHDNGWAEVDEALVLDGATGRLLDFMELPDRLKRETSLRGIERLSSDPAAAALVAQHRLHVYRRYADHAEWSAFFAEVTAARDPYLGAAGSRFARRARPRLHAGPRRRSRLSRLLQQLDERRSRGMRLRHAPRGNDAGRHARPVRWTHHRDRHRRARDRESALQLRGRRVRQARGRKDW